MISSLRVVVRGGGELGSAAARLLFLSGFRVVVLERAAPLAVRRPVSFASAVEAGETQVEGIRARLATADATDEPGGAIPVIVDEPGSCLRSLRPSVLVDARMAKRNLGTTQADATLVIGLGPGFTAGEDVHAVVETQRGPALGQVIWSGPAQSDTAVPAEIGGSSDDRVLRAPADGVFRASARIGDLVAAGRTVAEVSGQPVRSRIAGLLRGLLADGVFIESGVKVGDVDPRGARVDPWRISDKARTVAAGVLEAVFVWKGRSNSENSPPALP